MSFLRGFGGFGGGGGGFGGGGSSIGGAMIRIGANASGLRGQVRSAVNDVRGEFKNAARDIENTGHGIGGGFKRGSADAVASADKLGAAGEHASTRWRTAAKAAGVAITGLAVATAGVAGMAINAAIEYEDAFAGVAKTVDATQPQLDELNQQFIEMSQNIPVSAVEFAHLGEAAGQLGIKVGDIKEFARVTAIIGTTTNVSSDQAATALGQLSNVLKLTSDDYSRFASTLVDLGNKGASTESQILEMASRSGSAGALIHLTTQEVLGFSSALASTGVEVEAGGSSLQNFYLGVQKIIGAGSSLAGVAEDTHLSVGQITAAADKGGDALKKVADAANISTADLRKMVNAQGGLETLAGTAGMTGDQFQKAFKDDAGTALQAFLAGLGKLDAAEQLTVLQGLKFNDIRITRALLNLANNSQLVADNLTNANKAWDVNNAAQIEADKRFATTSSRIQVLQNRLTAMAISFGQKFLPPIVTVVEWLTDHLPAALAIVADAFNKYAAPGLRTLLDGFGKLVGVISDVLFGWGQIGQQGTALDQWRGAVETVARVIGGVASAFGQIAGFVATIAGAPVIRQLLTVAAILVTLSTVIGGTRALIGGLRGISGAAIRSLTFGKLGGGASPTATAESRAAVEAAGKLTGSAGALDRSAGALVESSVAIKEAAAGLARGMIHMPGDTRPRIVDAPGASVVKNAEGRIIATGTTALDRQMQEEGRLAAQGIVGRATVAVRNGLQRSVSTIRSVGGSALGLIGRAFWPLMIADIAGSIVAAPVGDFIANNTKFKRAGQRIKEDWIGGLGDLVQSIVAGTDEWVGHANEVTLGATHIKTITLAKLGITSAQIDTLEAPEGDLTAGVGKIEVNQQVMSDVQRRVGENVADWYRRVRDYLAEHGVDTSAMGTLLNRLQITRDPTERTQLEGELTTLMTRAVTGAAQVDVDHARTALGDGVSTALNQLGTDTGRFFGRSDVTKLTGEQVQGLSKILNAYVQGLITPDVATRMIALLTPAQPVGTPTQEPGGHVDETTHTGALVGPQSDLKIQVSLDRQSANQAQNDFNAWWAKLTPEQRQMSKLATAFLDQFSTQIAGAKDDKTKAALIKKINAAFPGLGIKTWDELITWTSALDQQSQYTVQQQIKQGLTRAAIGAILDGEVNTDTSNALQQFWGAAFTTAMSAPNTKAGDKVRAALLKQVNDAIPGKANDFKNWDALQKWWVAQLGKLDSSTRDHPTADIKAPGAEPWSPINGQKWTDPADEYVNHYTPPLIKPPWVRKLDQGGKNGPKVNWGDVSDEYVNHYTPKPIKPPKPKTVQQVDLKKAWADTTDNYVDHYQPVPFKPPKAQPVPDKTLKDAWFDPVDQRTIHYQPHDLNPPGAKPLPDATPQSRWFNPANADVDRFKPHDIKPPGAKPVPDSTPRTKWGGPVNAWVSRFKPGSIDAPDVKPPKPPKIPAGLFEGTGTAIGRQIVNGIETYISGTGVRRVAHTFRTNLPNSRAQRGPFAGEAWDRIHRSGRAIGLHLFAGMEASFARGMPVPPITIPSVPGTMRPPVPARIGVDPREVGGAVSQSLYIDRVNLLSAADDRSMMKRLRFMAPTGRR